MDERVFVVRFVSFRFVACVPAIRSSCNFFLPGKLVQKKKWIELREK